MSRPEYLINSFVKRYNSLNNKEKDVVLQKALDELNTLPEIDKNLVV